MILKQYYLGCLARTPAPTTMPRFDDPAAEVRKDGEPPGLGRLPAPYESISNSLEGTPQSPAR